MPNSDPESSAASPESCYEAREPHVQNPLIVAGSAVFLVFFSFVCVSSLLGWFARERPLNQMKPLGIISAPNLKPLERFPTPHLEIDDGHADAISLLQQQFNQLNSYGWVDREHGVVRIPIEQAIDLLATRGLPARTNGVSRVGDSELQLQQERPNQP